MLPIKITDSGVVMGEAKRRQKLDPNFGKPGFSKIQKPTNNFEPNSEFSSDDQLKPIAPNTFVYRGEILTLPQISLPFNPGFPLARLRDNFIQDAQLRVDMKKELEALNQYDRQDPFNLARRKLYTALLAIPLDSESLIVNQELSPALQASIVEAGKMLNEAEGISGMQDDLLWSFIPKPYRRLVDLLWDGIGGWKA
jgi:hypothetical protein